MQTPEYFATRNGAQKQFHALRDNEVPFPMPMMPYMRMAQEKEGPY
jgi:hypothetical protein